MTPSQAAEIKDLLLDIRKYMSAVVVPKGTGQSIKARVDQVLATFPARFEEQTRTATEREVVERCAAVAERCDGGEWEINHDARIAEQCGRDIAAAIRALSEQKS